MHLKLHLTYLRAERAEGFCHVCLKVWAGRSDAVGISSNNKNHSRINTAEQKEESGQGLTSQWGNLPAGTLKCVHGALLLIWQGNACVIFARTRAWDYVTLTFPTHNVATYLNPCALLGEAAGQGLQGSKPLCPPGWLRSHGSRRYCVLGSLVAVFCFGLGLQALQSFERQILHAVMGRGNPKTLGA